MYTFIGIAVVIVVLIVIVYLVVRNLFRRILPTFEILSQHDYKVESFDDGTDDEPVILEITKK